MKHVKYYILTLFIFCAVSSNAQNDWKYYTPKEGLSNFTVKSPSNLQYRRDTVYQDLNMILSEAYFVKSEDNIYMVTHLKYPEKMLTDDSMINDIIDHSIQGSAESLTGRVIYNEVLDDRRLKGKTYRIHYAGDEKTIKARIFFYKTSLYNIQVACPVDKSMDKEIDTFLNSFKLNDI